MKQILKVYNIYTNFLIFSSENIDYYYYYCYYHVLFQFKELKNCNDDLK